MMVKNLQDSNEELKNELTSHQPINEKDIESNQGQQISKSQLFIIFIGLILGCFVAGMDETILATANETITKELKSENMLTWMATSYVLTIVMFTPLYGKLSDIFGRKACLLFALVVFSIGSLGCALSNHIISFLIFRAISGIGGSGLISLAGIVLTDIVKLKDRATYMGILSLTFAVSNTLGPIIGGVIVDNTTWRLIFYINLPVTFCLALIIIFLMPLPWTEGSFKSKLNRVDFLGSFVLTLSILLFVLGTSWGGKDYPWASAPVIASLILSVLLIFAFFWIELRYAKEPVLPLPMFTKNVQICIIITIILGCINFTVVYYMPVYHQFLRETSASEAGYQLAPFLVIMCLAAIISGMVASRFKSFRFSIWLGTSLMTIGTGLLCMVNVNIELWKMILFPIFIGFGIGFTIQLTLIGSQASVSKEYVAIITSFINFALNFGGVISLAIDGSIMNNVLSKYDILTNQDIHNLHTESISMTSKLAYSEGLKIIFYVGLGIGVISFLLSLFLDHKSLDEDDENNEINK